MINFWVKNRDINLVDKINDNFAYQKVNKVGREAVDVGFNLDKASKQFNNKNLKKRENKVDKKKKKNGRHLDVRR